MKITIISPGGLPVPAIKGGAVETLIHEYIKQNSINQDFDIDLFGCYDKELEKINILKCKLYLFKQSKILKSIFKVLNIKHNKLIKLKNIIEEKRYINYINRNIQSSDYILIENKPHLINSIKVNHNCKKILHLHNSHISVYNKEIFERYDKILCVSNYIKKEIVRIHEIDECKIDVWYNCVSDYFLNDNYKLSTLKNDLKIKDEDYVIAFVGRITPEKGIDKIIEALKVTSISNLKLLIIGASWFNVNNKTKYMKELEYRAQEIKEKIIFTGYIDHKDIPGYIELANMVILPSIWDEPFGLTIIESMALGKAVISTNKGGIPEISKGEDIILLNYDNLIPNLVKNIEYYYKHSTERDRIGNNAKQTVIKHFTSEKYYKRFKEIVGQL